MNEGQWMSVQNHQIIVQSTGRTDIIDLTEQVSGVLRDSFVQNGTVTLFIPGSTGRYVLRTQRKVGRR